MSNNPEKRTYEKFRKKEEKTQKIEKIRNKIE